MSVSVAAGGEFVVAACGVGFDSSVEKTIRTRGMSNVGPLMSV